MAVDSCTKFSGEDCLSFVSSGELLVVDSAEERKEFVCIEYPGVVVNDENALKTLGGLENISKACTGKGYSRLELRFRPSDSYCKPAIARKSNPCCLAIKVRRRRKRGVVAASNGSSEYEYSGEMLGVINTLFEFTGMSDFQVLPPGLSDFSHHNSREPIDHNLYQLTGLYDETLLSKDLPEFTPPISVFSKLDRPANYCYKPDAKHNFGTNTDKPIQQIPGKARLRRSNLTYGITFDSKDDIPSVPKPGTPNTNHPKLAALKALFDERPVWSRSALQAKLKISPVVCKQLLPLVAYNFTSGPWRTLWVRFGYDPRSSPEGKIYQCLDFRVPRMLESSVVAPSKNYRQRMIRPFGVGGEPSSSWRMGLPQNEEKRSMRQAQERLGENSQSDDETAYIFDPECLPQQRQQFFQLCDLHADSLQALIHNNDGKETNCNELSGWCEADTYDKLRKQIIELITSKATKEGILLGGRQASAEEGGGAADL